MDEKIELESESGVSYFSSVPFVLILVLIPAGLIGFFAYKLINSLREKERKKEEKKKIKLQKKDGKKKH